MERTRLEGRCPSASNRTARILGLARFPRRLFRSTQRLARGVGAPTLLAWSTRRMQALLRPACEEGPVQRSRKRTERANKRARRRTHRSRPLRRSSGRRRRPAIQGKRSSYREFEPSAMLRCLGRCVGRDRRLPVLGGTRAGSGYGGGRSGTNRPACLDHVLCSPGQLERLIDSVV